MVSTGGSGTGPILLSQASFLLAHIASSGPVPLSASGPVPSDIGCQTSVRHRVSELGRFRPLTPVFLRFPGSFHIRPERFVGNTGPGLNALSGSLQDRLKPRRMGHHQTL